MWKRASFGVLRLKVWYNLKDLGISYAFIEPLKKISCCAILVVSETEGGIQLIDIKLSRIIPIAACERLYITSNPAIKASIRLCRFCAGKFRHQ